MAKPALLETLHRIAEPVITSMGLEIWGMEVLQTGRCVVRIYVDTPPDAMAGDDLMKAGSDTGTEEKHSPERLSVSVDQCADISRMLGLALEVEDVFSAAYVLEVSSPGLSRVFFRPEQLPPYVGDEVEVALREAHPDWPGRKKFRGTLTAVHGDMLTLRIAAAQAGDEGRQADVSIAWGDVRRAERIHIFSMPEKPGRRKRAAGK